MNGLAGQGSGPGPGAVWDRPPSPSLDSSQQRASELFLLREALQSLPPSVADAISHHVSCTNEALQKAEAERRSLMRSLTAAQAQLAYLPQMQVYRKVGVDVRILPVFAQYTAAAFLPLATSAHAWQVWVWSSNISCTWLSTEAVTAYAACTVHNSNNDQQLLQLWIEC